MPLDATATRRSPPQRSPLASVSPNKQEALRSPEQHGTPVKRVLQARTFSPDVEVRLPPTPSPHKAASGRSSLSSPSPAKQASGMASDLAKHKVFMRMQQTCKTPEGEERACDDGGAQQQQEDAHMTPPAMPADSPMPPTPVEANTPASATPLGTPGKSPGTTPGWDGTPARRLKEEAAKLRNMSRLNSPALASSRRSLECKNAVGDELARTRSKLASAEAKVRSLETPSPALSNSRSDLLSFETSTPIGLRIGSQIPRLSTERRASTSGPPPTASPTPAADGDVTVIIRVVNDPAASARSVALKPSASRAGSVLAQLKNLCPEFEGGKVIVRATAERGWERVSKADDLAHGEQCYLLFDPSDKEKLPAVALDQARLAAAVSNPSTAARTGQPKEPTALGVPGFRTTVSEQQAEIEAFRAQLATRDAELKAEVSKRKVAETRLFEAFEEIAGTPARPTAATDGVAAALGDQQQLTRSQSLVERMKALSPDVVRAETLAPYPAKTAASGIQQQVMVAPSVDLGLFAEELNEANERANYYQARVVELEAEISGQGAAGRRAEDGGGDDESDCEEQEGGVWQSAVAATPGKKLAGAWVALGNKWNLGGGGGDKGGNTTPKRRSPTRAAATPGGAKCHYTAV